MLRPWNEKKKKFHEPAGQILLEPLGVDLVNVSTTITFSENGARPSPRKWRTSYFIDEVFREALHRGRNLLGLSGDPLIVALSRACDATMTRQVHPRNR